MASTEGLSARQVANKLNKHESFYGKSGGRFFKARMRQEWLQLYGADGWVDALPKETYRTPGGTFIVKWEGEE